MTIEHALARVLPALPLRLVPGRGRAGHVRRDRRPRERAERIPEDRSRCSRSAEILRRDEDNLRVKSDDPLEALLGRQALMPLGRLDGGGPDGRLLGIVTWDQVRRALQQGTAGAASAMTAPAGRAVHIGSRAVPEHDVLVIGAGLAGQRAALSAAQAGASVGIISKVHPVRSHSNAAQGGINAALNPEDSLGIARLRHGQGIGLPRRPGRDRDHVPGGPRRAAATRAHGRHLPPQSRGPARAPAPSAAPRPPAPTTWRTSPARRSCTSSTSS